MIGDIMRSLGFGLAALLLVFLAIRKTISNLVLGIGLIVLVLIDLITIDVKYLNYESYRDPQDTESFFVKTKFDEEILADKSYFRVYNESGNAFFDAITSYHYNSLGGYHAAKIAIYQELVEQKFGRQASNTYVPDMLNVKYLIRKDQNG